MNAMTAKRVRMFFDTDEELKLAIQLEALKQDVSASEIIERILRREFKGTLAEARKILQDRAKKPKE